MSKRQVKAAEQLRRAIRAAEARGVTQYQIAKAAGMQRSQIKRIAEGLTTPALDTAQRIADVIGVSIVIVAKKTRKRI